jgi:hypothetical protein
MFKLSGYTSDKEAISVEMLAPIKIYKNAS